MLLQEIHVIGNDDFVYLLGLLGINGTILEKSESEFFVKEFNKIVNNSSIGLIIIAIILPDNIIDFLIDFKLNNRSPVIFYLPDIFNANIENEDIILNIVLKSMGKIIS